ncbi:hypothetical protein BJ741DRAFT_669348 [Chytriomyces cf. hyalinus JEL632]|nr:hypothetical protein BJ741DRAFT_669348 [Chytriomyces cf. hyalinus JEL632]
MFHTLSPNSHHDSDLQQHLRRLQHQKRQEQAYRQRLIDLARLQHAQEQQNSQCRQAKQHQQRLARNKRLNETQSMWESFPLSPSASESDSDAELNATKASKTRSIPIFYANERASVTPPPGREDNLAESTDMDIDTPTLQSSQDQETAARVIQSWYRSKLVPRKLLRQVTTLAKSFHTQFPRNKRVWRERLATLASTLEMNASTRKLVPGAKGNKGLMEVEEALTKMLLKADAIESHGYEVVREARKVIIREVQRLLDDIEAAKQESMARLSRQD